MKLDVTGVETIELTDPRGFCNPPVLPQQGFPMPIIPLPFTPTPLHPVPGISTVVPSIWSRNPPSTSEEYLEKWGKGLTRQTEPHKWEKGWQSKLSPDQEKDALDHGL